MLCGCILAFAAILGVELPSAGQILIDGRKAAVRNQVESAEKIVTGFARQAETGGGSVEEAQRRAGDALRAIRYSDNSAR
jgi:methyl-accepting chemotaxis protein